MYMYLLRAIPLTLVSGNEIVDFWHSDHVSQHVAQPLWVHEVEVGQCWGSVVEHHTWGGGGGGGEGGREGREGEGREEGKGREGGEEGGEEGREREEEGREEERGGRKEKR